MFSIKVFFGVYFGLIFWWIRIHEVKLRIHWIGIIRTADNIEYWSIRKTYSVIDISSLLMITDLIFRNIKSVQHPVAKI